MLKWSDGEAALFSLKCLLAGCLALWSALAIGLNRPYWAIITSYFIAQPLAGAVLSKALYRIVGTAIGGAAAILFVPPLVNEPMVLATVMGLWLSFCIYVSQLDRTPRSYALLLAGFTATVIVFPDVGSPATVFDVASERVQEIVIGIVSASLIHGLVMPRTVSAAMIVRARAVVTDAEAWSAAALTGPSGGLEARRRRLAVDITDLHQLSTHLPFDPARLSPPVRAVRALQDRLTLLLPLASAIEDRVSAMRACPAGVPGAVHRVIASASCWMTAGSARDGAQPLLVEIEHVTSVVEIGSTWRDMLALSALGRLGELVEAHRDARALIDSINSEHGHGTDELVMRLLRRAGRRRFHVDHLLALRSASAGLFVTLLGCAWWIATAWPDGSTATLFAGVLVSFFGGLDDRVGAMLQFLRGALWGLVVATVLTIFILSGVDSFPMLVLALAPALLVFGSMIAKPAHVRSGLGGVAAMVNFSALGNGYAGDVAVLLNGAVAFVIGILLAVAVSWAMGRVGVELQTRRLLRAGYDDVARRARGEERDRDLWMSRMIDRIGLLVPLAAASAGAAPRIREALIDLRIGVVAGELADLASRSSPEEQEVMQLTLAAIARKFANRHAGQGDMKADALATMDATIAVYARDDDPERRRPGLAQLAALRRNLYPDASAFGVT